MTTGRTDRPLALIFFFRLFAVVGVVPFLFNTVDILMHINAPTMTQDANPLMRVLMGLVAAPLTFAIAVLCIRRAPDNLIGWSLVSFAYGNSVQMMRAGLLPLTLQLFLINELIGLFWFAYVLIPLYFPNGRLYPPRTNRWGNLLVSFITLSTLVIPIISAPTFHWGSGSRELSVPNPLLVIEWDYPMLTIPLTLALLIGGILVLILRYRGSGEIERLQLRWFLFGVIVQGAMTIFVTWNPRGFERLSAWITSLYFLIIPIAIGIAVLRYRLYDIDLIIRRTLQYTALSAILGLVYFGSVVLLRQLLSGVTGNSSVAIVLSTLLIAAMFSPLRRRFQEVIDRRFFRQKYNAERALSEFYKASRDEVELEKIENHLIKTVSQTIQPAHVSLWLRKVRKPHG